MKLEHIKYIILLFFYTVLATSVCAQTDNKQSSDTTKTVKGERVTSPRTVYSAGNYGFNAAERWAMQGRYRKADSVKYSNNNIFSHMYFGLSAGMNQFVGRKEFLFDPGQTFGIIIGKELNKFHTLSILGELGNYPLKSGWNELKTYSLQLNHHFNFTRYYFGYNPYRTVEFSSTIGVGMQNAELIAINTETPELQGDKENAKFVLLGLLANIKLGSRSSLSLEPHLALGTEGYNGAPAGYWYSKYNILYGMRGSLNYELHNDLPANIYANKIVFPQNYMFMAGGLQASDASIDREKTLGAYFNFGFRHWFDKCLALQISTGYSSGAWNEMTTAANESERTPEYRYMSRTQHVFGRLEAVANVLKIGKNNLNNDVSLNLLGGYEYGHQWKYKGNNIAEQTNSWYGGPTAAMQLKYHSCEGKAIFLEPRVSFINYEIPYKYPHSHIKEKFNDTRYTLALGMEFGITPELSAGNNVTGIGNDTLHAIAKRHRFSPEISLFTGAGVNYMLERGYYDGSTRYNMTYSAGLEYQPFAPVGIRLMYDFSRYAFNSLEKYAVATNNIISHKTGLWQKNYYVSSGIFDLKFDLTNIVHGYYPGRKWNTAVYVGPIFSKHSRLETEIYDKEIIPEGASIKLLQEKSEDSHWGLHAALNTRYNITPSWGVFGEAGVKIYKNEFINEQNLDYNPVRAISAQLGVNYRMLQKQMFSRKNWNTIKQPINYIFFAPGVQMNNSSIDFEQKLGPYISLGAGRWLTKHVALQVSGGYASGSWHKTVIPEDIIKGTKEYHYYSKVQQAFGRIEAVTNIFNTIKDTTTAGAGGFSVNILGGYEFGKQWKYLTNAIELQQNASYGGLTGAMQFKFHSVEGKALFIEPRVSFVNYQQKAEAPFETMTEDKSDIRYSVAVGVEYGSGYRQKSRKEGFENREMFKPELSIFAAGGGNYLFERGYYDGKARRNYSFAMGIEYQPLKNFGARLMLDHSAYCFNSISKYNMVLDNNITSSNALWNKKYNVVSTILDAKFDITNMLYGYNSERRWNTAIYMGPMLSKHSSIDAEIDDCETIPEGGKVRLTEKRPRSSHWGLHAALNTRYNITPSWGVFGEAGVKIYKNEFINEQNLDYNPVRAISAQLGVNYRMLQNELFSRKQVDKIIQPASYMFFTTGLQGDNSSVSFGNNLGSNISMGVGRWISRRIALQFSGGYSNCNWHETTTPANEIAGHPEYTYYSKSQHLIGRIEAVTNLFTTIKERNDIVNKFSFNLSGGYEFGKQWKYRTNDRDMQIDASFGGVTGAMQFKFHSVEGKALFIEPRVSIVKYNAPDAYPFESYEKQYTDVRYSLAVGIEYGTTPAEGKKALNSTPVTYIPELWINASAGTNYMFERGHYGGDARFNKAIAFGIEYQPFAKLGARFSLDYSNYDFNTIQRYKETVKGDVHNNIGLWHNSYNVLSGIFDLKLDITNIFSHYTPERKWSTAFYFGPIVSKHLKHTATLNKDEPRTPDSAISASKKSPEGIHFGLHTAFNTSYRINDRWGLFGEMGIKVYKNDFINETYLDYNPVRAITWQMGVKYNIK